MDVEWEFEMGVALVLVGTCDGCVWMWSMSLVCACLRLAVESGCC